MSQETIEQSFKVPATARLKLSNICGSVDIRPGEDGVIQVTVTKHTDTGDANRTEIELNQAADGTVIIETHFPDDFWMSLFGSRPCALDYVVKAPRACSMQVNGVSNAVIAEGFIGEFEFASVSGEMMLHSLTGSLKVNTVCGKMALGNLTGSFKVNTVSGDLSGERLSGCFDLNTVSGDVTLAESTLPSVAATTVSGNLRLHTALGEGPYQFNSVSGDLVLVLPGNTRCSATLHTVSGQISSSLPLSSHYRSHGSQVAQVQGGGVGVSIHSVSGHLFLDNGGTVESTLIPNPVSSLVNHREILARIERGEMAVEEGLTQLQGK